MSSEIIQRREEIKALAASCKTINEKPVETFWLERDPLTGERFEIPQGGQHAHQAAA